MSSQHAWNQVLAEVAIEAGQAVVAAVTAIPLDQRSQKQQSVLKPPPGLAAVPDCVGEDAAFAILQQLASRLACEVRVIIDQHNYHSIKPTGAMFRHVWTYLDAVDGTIKVAGLGNEPKRVRAANDGSWAVGIALGYPTDAELQDLKLSDFKVGGRECAGADVICSVSLCPVLWFQASPLLCPEALVLEPSSAMLSAATLAPCLTCRSLPLWMGPLAGVARAVTIAAFRSRTLASW